MAEKVAKAGVKRQEGYLYFIDKAGDISRVKMARGGKKGGKPEKVAKVGVEKETGFLYFIDKAGDVSRAKMVRRGKSSKASKAAKKPAKKKK
jgi:20S proteasome alpha/beta subunit